MTAITDDAMWVPPSHSVGAIHCSCQSCVPIQDISSAARILTALDAVHDVGGWLMLYETDNADAAHVLHVWAESRCLTVERHMHPVKDGASFEVLSVTDGHFRVSVHRPEVTS